MALYVQNSSISYDDPAADQRGEDHLFSDVDEGDATRVVHIAENSISLESIIQRAERADQQIVIAGLREDQAEVKALVRAGGTVEKGYYSGEVRVVFDSPECY